MLAAAALAQLQRCTAHARLCSTTVSKSEALALVKEVRARTGAPLGDVRKALEEAEYDVQAAQDVLRKMGVASAAKKAERTAQEVHVTAHLT